MQRLFILLLILIISVPLFLVSLLAYIGVKAGQDTKTKSDVIMVLGGRVISGTDCFGPICAQIGFVPRPHYNPCVVARVDHAVSLYKQGYAPRILMSGGTDEDNVNEAETMKKIAVDAGIPESAILTETKSTSTYENFAFSRRVLADAGLKSVIVVTEPYHNARAGLVASKLGYAYSLSPATKSPCWDNERFLGNWNFLKKEVAALIGYIMFRRI